MIGWPARSFSGSLHAADRREGGHQVEAADDFVVLGVGRDLARHPGDGRNAVAAFAQRALGAAERRVAGVGIDVLPGAVVGRVEHQRVVGESASERILSMMRPMRASSSTTESAYLLLDIDLWM